MSEMRGGENDRKTAEKERSGKRFRVCVKSCWRLAPGDSDLLAPYFFFFSSGPHALMKLFLSRFYATTAPAPAPAPVVGSCIL